MVAIAAKEAEAAAAVANVANAEAKVFAKMRLLSNSPKVQNASTYVETSRAVMEINLSFASDVTRRPLTRVGRSIVSPTTPK